MNRLNLKPHLATQRELGKVIEPLASYICAASCPPATLATAVAFLIQEVEQTTRAARAHVASFAEENWS